MTIALIAHGGAGNLRPGGEQLAVEGMLAAVQAGRAVLAAGGSATDAVCATVVALEDNPAYQFISDNARGASRKFGVKSISLLAVKR